jgi:hypothetical protein
VNVVLAMVAAALVAVALLGIAARSAITVCVAEIKDGKIEVTHGGIAPRVLADLGDVVSRPRVERGTLRIVRSRGLARVEASGDLTLAQRQQLRNVVGSLPLAKLANARRRR